MCVPSRDPRRNRMAAAGDATTAGAAETAPLPVVAAGVAALLSAGGAAGRWRGTMISVGWTDTS